MNLKTDFTFSKLKFFFLVLIISFCFLSCEKKNEKEPNDTPGNAHVFVIQKNDLAHLKPASGLVHFFEDQLQNTKKRNSGNGIQVPATREELTGKIINIWGSFNSADDRDCFRIKTPPGFFTLKLDAIKGINGAIELIYPQNPKRIKIIDDFRKSDEEIVALQRTFKDHIFCFTQGYRDQKKNAPEITYHAQYIFYHFSLSDQFFLEREPNDDIQNSTAIPLNQITIGAYSPGLNIKNENKDNLYREEDWFRLSFPKEEPGFLQFQLEVSPVKGADPILLIYDADRKKLIGFDNYLANEGERTSFLRLYPGQSYYIRLFSKIIRNIPSSFYSMRLVFQNQENIEFEPNNSPLEANNLKDGKQGFLSHTGDEDYFRFSTGDSGNIFFGSVRFPQRFSDPYFEILNDEEKSIYRTKGSAKEAKLAGFFLKKGIYYLKLADSLGSFSSKDSYKIKISLQKPSAFGERESNDDIKNANPFTWDKSLKRIGPSFLVPENDIDYYLIKIKDNKRKRFRFVVESDSSGLEIAITDSMGFILKKKTKKGSQQIALSETIDGTGYIIVRYNNTKSAEINNPYFIYLYELN